MDLGMLADLQRAEMEAERLRLPAQVLHVAVGDPVEPIGHQGRLELVDLRDECLGRWVGTGQRGDVTGQSRPRAAQALGHRPESTSIRLAREPPIELAGEVGQFLRVAGEAALEGVG